MPVQESLEERCEKNGLSLEAEVEDFGDGYRQGVQYLCETGGDWDWKLFLTGPLDYAWMLNTRFEQYRPLNLYDAMWSRSKGVVECQLGFREPAIGKADPVREVAQAFGVGGEHPSTTFMAPGGVGVNIQFSSAELLIWRAVSPAVHLISSGPPVPAVRIEGLTLGSESGARIALEKYANAALLQIFQKTGIALRLNEHRAWMPRFQFTDSDAPRPRADPLLAAPEAEPASYFWYGLTTRANLTGTFQSFYQVAEYYFPQMGEKTERKALKALLLASVQRQDLVDFIQSDHARKAFYDLRPPPLVARGISYNVAGADILAEAAERLYDIRCRVVHSKRAQAPLRPLSPEVAKLRVDTDLMEFVAARVLEKMSVNL